MTIELSGLSESEYGRLERVLCLVRRDREIRASFDRMKARGVASTKAIERLADCEWSGQYLTPGTIRLICYNR